MFWYKLLFQFQYAVILYVPASVMVKSRPDIVVKVGDVKGNAES